MGSGSSTQKTQQSQQQTIKSEKAPLMSTTTNTTNTTNTTTAACLRPITALSERNLTEAEVKRATAIGKNRGI